MPAEIEIVMRKLEETAKAEKEGKGIPVLYVRKANNEDACVLI